MSEEKIRYLLGNEIQTIKPLEVYSDIVCDFLEDLAKAIRDCKESRLYPDVMTFAFWCRKANIIKLKEDHHFTKKAIGRGLAFHIAPSNVPINFAFSMAFGLLAGNANLVRVSGKEFPQTRLVCDCMQKVLDIEKYQLLKLQNAVVSYEHDKEITDKFSEKCDVRIIWGGDATIEEIRKSPIKSRCVEVAFADRYSIAIFDGHAMAALSEEEIKHLAQKFYNDTYLMDQNACSSPQMVFWRNGVEKRFWECLYQEADKYDLQEKKVTDKLTLVCRQTASEESHMQLVSYGNLLYVIEMETIPASIDNHKARFGVFYEAKIESLEDIAKLLTDKIQTCVCYGIKKDEVADFVISHHIQGIDRVVDIGEAMDINVQWDGYDVIRTMSRQIIC